MGRGDHGRIDEQKYNKKKFIKITEKKLNQKINKVIGKILI